MYSINRDVQFPLYCVPPILRLAITEVEMKTQAPVALIFGVAMAASALAAQGAYRVQSPVGKISPLALYFLAVASSGSGKTSAEAHFLKPIAEFEAQRMADAREEFKTYSGRKAAWEAARDRLTKRIRKTEDEASLPELTAQLVALEHERPMPPSAGQQVFTDCTTAALLRGVADAPMGAGLFTDEGGLLLNGPATMFQPMCELWDGTGYRINRGSSVTTITAPFSMSVMIQPKAFERFGRRTDAPPRDSGVMPRFLICHESAAFGRRNFSNAQMAAPHLEACCQRLTELLSLQTPQDADRTIVTFDDAAQEASRAFGHRLEILNLPGQRFSGIPEATSKALENVTRVAGVFAVMQGRSVIDIDTFNSAMRCVYWFVDQYKKIVPDLEVPDVEKDAKLLMQWMSDRCQTNIANCNGAPYGSVPKKVLIQSGPNSLRSARRLNAALTDCVDRGWLQVFTHGGATYVRP